MNVCHELLMRGKMRRSTEKQSCGSFTNLNVGDVWGPYYGLLPTLGMSSLAALAWLLGLLAPHLSA